MASLGISVMAHRKREHLIPRLIDRLGLTSDHVVWDRHDNRWDTGRRAMQAAADQKADYSAVVQDDVLVCNDLLAGLERALEHVPDERIVQPFVGARRPLQGYIGELVVEADEQQASWIEMRALMWGTVIAVPTATIPDMLAWADRRTYPQYDKRVGQYFYTRLHWPVYYPWPCLTDHLDADRDGVDSLVEHGGGRVAHNFVGEGASALDFDWSGPIVQMRGLKQMQMRRNAARTVRERRASPARAAPAGRAGTG